MAAPKISIITVTYNCEAVVEATILSVATQTYSNIEHIIVDGQSTDQTFDIVSRYRENLSHCLSEPDRGLYDAMNKGLGLATGEYVFFLNSGDIFASADALARLIASASDLTAIIYGYVKIEASFGWWYSPYEGAQFATTPSYLPHHQSIIYPSAYYRNNRFDLRFPTQADIIFTFKACRDYQSQYVPVLTVNSTLGGYSTHLFNSLPRVKALIGELSEIAAIQKGGLPHNHRFGIALNLYIKFGFQKVFGERGLFELVRFNAYRSAWKRRISKEKNGLV